MYKNWLGYGCSECCKVCVYVSVCLFMFRCLCVCFSVSVCKCVDVCVCEYVYIFVHMFVCKKDGQRSKLIRIDLIEFFFFSGKRRNG